VKIHYAPASVREHIMAENKKSTTTSKKTTAGKDAKPKAAPKTTPAKKTAPKAAVPKTAAPKNSAPRAKKAAPAHINEESRLHMIREAAYYRALHRGFGGGAEAEDWCAAEREIDVMLGKLTG
jgi:hypothetical protein